MDFTNVREWTIPEGKVKKAYIGSQLVWQSPYDSEVQYLESTGTQYILLPPGDYKGIDITCLPQVQQTSILPGCVGRFYIRVAYDTIVFWLANGQGFAVCSTVPVGAGYTRAISYNVNQALTRIQVHGTSVMIGDDAFQLQYPWSNTVGNIDGSTIPFALFGCYKRTTGDVEVSQCKIGRCKIWTGLGDNETLAYDFMPVRIGTVGAMYDQRGVGGMNPDGSVRNDGLYYNQGTGNFVLGLDVE